MAQLHNRVSQAELKKLLYEETEPRTTLSFYRYFSIENPKQFRDDMYTALNALKVFGRIYIAREGINAQVSIPSTNLPALQDYLASIEQLKGIRLNEAVGNNAASGAAFSGKSFGCSR